MVADRAAQEPRAQVEAEDERCVGHRLRSRRRRSWGGRDRCVVSRTSSASRSDWSASDTVGFEIPARREISAREIGAPARDRLQHRALVQVLEQRRDRTAHGQEP